MKKSIGAQVYVSLVLSLLTIWVAVVVAVAWVVRHETDEIFDAGLQETAQRLLILTLREHADAPEHAQARVFESPEHREYLTFQLADHTGHILVRSHNAPLQAFPTPLRTGSYVVGDQHYRVESSKEQDYFITLAENKGHRDSTLKDVLMYLLMPLLALIPLTAVAILFSLRVARRALAALDTELAIRSSHHLEPIDTAHQPVELRGLADSVNALMQRLRLALESERHFTANSAHELRTPIASAMAQLDVLKAQLPDAASRERVLLARRHLERLHQTTEKLLQLARAESGKALDLAEMDLVGVTQMLVDEPSLRSGRRHVFSHPGEPVVIQADVDAVGIIIVNLLENADKYAPPGTDIHVLVDRQGALHVRNDCEALSAAFMAIILERFARADSRVPGAGIGLAIVHTIAAQCRARLTLRSPCDDAGRGFQAVVAFSTVAARGTAGFSAGSL